MKIQLTQVVSGKDNIRAIRSVSKEYDYKNFPYVPRVGDTIYDSAYERDAEYKVAEVGFNVSDDYIHVILEPVELDTSDENVVKDYVKVMMLHGWECPHLEMY